MIVKTEKDIKKRLAEVEYEIMREQNQINIWRLKTEHKELSRQLKTIENRKKKSSN